MNVMVIDRCINNRKKITVNYEAAGAGTASRLKYLLSIVPPAVHRKPLGEHAPV